MTATTFDSIDDEACAAYAERGAICLRDVFTDWVELTCEEWFPVLWPRSG